MTKTYSFIYIVFNSYGNGFQHIVLNSSIIVFNILMYDFQLGAKTEMQ